MNAVKELKKLAAMICKYSHRWNGGECSHRMRVWMNKYNQHSHDRKPEWFVYCKETRSCPTHDAYDLLA